MSLAVPLPVALSVLLAIAAPRAVRRAPPEAATRGLTAAAVVASAGYATCLLMLASTLVEDLLRPMPGLAPRWGAERFRERAKPLGRPGTGLVAALGRGNIRHAERVARWCWRISKDDGR